MPDYQDSTSKSSDPEPEFTSDSSREQLPRYDWIVKDIFPAREIHLIHGPSYIGKTRITIKHIIDPIEHGQPVWGHQSTQCRCAYIACDNRSKKSIDVTLNQIGARPHKVISARDDRIIRPTLDWVLNVTTDCSVVVLDPISRFMPGSGREMNDYQLMADFLCKMGIWCDDNNITVLGLHHDGKSNEATKDRDARERILGSSALSGYSETIVSMGYYEAGDRDRKIVRVYVEARNNVKENYSYQWMNKGVPEYVEGAAKSIVLDIYFKGQPIGTTFTTELIKTWAESVTPMIQDSTYYDWLQKMQTDQLVREVGKQGRFKLYQKVADRAEDDLVM